MDKYIVRNKRGEIKRLSNKPGKYNNRETIGRFSDLQERITRVCRHVDTLLYNSGTPDHQQRLLCATCYYNSLPVPTDRMTRNEAMTALTQYLAGTLFLSEEERETLLNKVIEAEVDA